MSWGTLQAVGIRITRELERSAFYRDRVPKLLKQLAVFVFVCFAWIFFRAGSVSDAMLIVSRIFHSAWSSPQIPALMLLLVGLFWLYQFVYESRLSRLLSLRCVRLALSVGLILSLCLCSSGGGAFIYFHL